ncbi:hypothetical protein [Polaromonas sp.]|uniref:hypothetical protein n=1 Tax=Polaromonas sp. TaxID=1869339 RepID=UPI0013B7E580|nr:hypothetical protein [Polaromonas sp.]
MQTDRGENHGNCEKTSGKKSRSCASSGKKIDSYSCASTGANNTGANNSGVYQAGGQKGCGKSACEKGCG